MWLPYCVDNCGALAPKPLPAPPLPKPLPSPPSIHLKCLMLCDYSWALQPELRLRTRSPARNGNRCPTEAAATEAKLWGTYMQIAHRRSSTQVELGSLTTGRTNQAGQKCSTPKWANKHRVRRCTEKKTARTEVNQILKKYNLVKRNITSR